MFIHVVIVYFGFLLSRRIRRAQQKVIAKSSFVKEALIAASARHTTKEINGKIREAFDCFTYIDSFISLLGMGIQYVFGQADV